MATVVLLIVVCCPSILYESAQQDAGSWSLVVVVGN